MLAAGASAAGPHSFSGFPSWPPRISPPLSPLSVRCGSAMYPMVFAFVRIFH